MHWLSRLLPLCALAALLLVSAEQPAPARPVRKPGKRAGSLLGPLPAHGQIQITANGLHIEPGKKVNFLRFDGGVEVSGPGFSLKAQVVEMDVLSSSLGLKDVKLPQLTEAPERVIADPGTTVQRMVSEIHGPSTKFEASALQRIAASGQIAISAAGASLSTETVFSTDGGQSWSTGGPAHISLSDKSKGQQVDFTAGLISFNSTSQEIIARGSVSGTFVQSKQPPLKLETGELRGELKTGMVSLVGGVKASSGTMQLSTTLGAGAPPVHFSLRTQQLSIDGPFALSDSGRKLSLDGAGVSASLSGKQQISARGPVHLASGADDLDLTASGLEAVLDPLKLTATGKVHVSYKGSAYDAEHAVVTQQGKKLILEMQGKQSGRISLDELKTKK